MLRLDEQGFEQIDLKIRENEEKIRILNRVKGEAVDLDKSTANNAALDFAKNEHISLKTQIDELKNDRNNSILVKSHGDQNCVDLYDIVTVYDKTIDDEYQVILTGKYDPKQDGDIDEITLNSPLGQIFGKKKGEIIPPYEIRGVKHYVEVRDFTKSTNVNETTTTDEKTTDLK